MSHKSQVTSLDMKKSVLYQAEVRNLTFLLFFYSSCKLPVQQKRDIFLSSIFQLGVCTCTSWYLVQVRSAESAVYVPVRFHPSKPESHNVVLQ